jgi:hypothetical protein
MNAPQHPTFNRLTDLAEGRVDGAGRANLVAHVEGCATCATSLGWLERALGTMRATLLEEPPPSVVSRAARLLRQRAAGDSPRRGLIPTLARLLFDSGQAAGGLAFGLRAGRATSRQLLFGAGEHELELRIVAETDRWTIRGQVLGACDGTGAVEISGPTSRRTQLNDVCEFALAELPAGVYRLSVRLGDAQIDVPELLVGV